MGRRSKARLAQNRSSLSRPTSGSKIFPSETRSRPNWQIVTVCVFLAGAVWAVFSQTLQYDFINYDDNEYVSGNPAINHGLNWHWIVWIFLHSNAGTWFPLTDLSHQLDWQLYGSNAGGHHLTNVLLHALAAICLFLALQKLTRAFWCSAFAAAVFAIHPLRVESVAWVTERKDVLSGLFFMLTLWAWAGHAQQQSHSVNTGDQDASMKRWHWTPQYFLALAFYALGLLSKSMLVTLPLILLLLDYWPLRRLPSDVAANPRRLFQAWLGLLLEKAPFVLLSIALCVVTVMTQMSEVSVAGKHAFLWRAGNALQAYADYLGHMIYPVGLMLVYPHSITNPSLGKSLLAALILIGVPVGVIVGRRKHPYLLVGWFWYLGMLLPVIDIMQTAQNARADRYTYLPQIGLCILMIWGAVDVCRSWRHRQAVLGTVAVAVLASLLIFARVQTEYWKDSVTLWTHSLACSPENTCALTHLGSALMTQGQTNEAMERFQQALQIEPDNAEAHDSLGLVLARQGYMDDAIQHYERALEIKPEYSEAHNNLGLALAGQGKLDEAIEHYKQATRFKPFFAEAYNNAGIALARQGKLDEAAESCKQALQIKPEYAVACYNLALALVAQGKLNEARPRFQQALNLAAAQNDSALVETIRASFKFVEEDPPPGKP